MFTYNSKYGNVKIYAETLEDSAMSQIVQMANSPLGEDAHIRIMPDAHAGAGCTIGTTMYVTDKVCPNIVGVDIGCGMLGIAVGKVTEDEYKKLAAYCEENVVAGCKVRAVAMHGYEDLFNKVRSMHCAEALKDRWGYFDQSLGTLGGGNHFIELDKEDDGCHWLVIHTGSRNLGKCVADYYQKIASDTLKENFRSQRRAVIEEGKAKGEFEQIGEKLKAIQKMPATGLEYLTDTQMANYLDDMRICQFWAAINRHVLAQDICKYMGWDCNYGIETIHNYIDIDGSVILRKGAISAKKGEYCLIPMNMRDGTLICRGKGNPDWNFSAPHGAGRIMSRAEAKKNISMEDYLASMEGIVSTTINKSTIDESAFAYKPMAEIVNAIGPTVEIISVMKPVFNYKAAE